MSETKVRKPRAKAAATGGGAVPVASGAPVTTMDIRIGNKAFAAALSRAGGFITRGNTVPILRCVALTAGSGILAIEASNTEQALRQSLPITGMGFGGGCVDWERLIAVVRRLPPDAESTLEFTGAALVVRCGAARATITLWPLSDFPVFRLQPDTGTSFALSAPALAAMLSHVTYAIGQGQIQFYLCGISLSARGNGDDGWLRAAATNGNDLAIVRIPLPPGADGMPDIIIPTVAVTELEKLVRGADTVDLSITPLTLIATVGDMVLLTKLIAATFPDYDRVIPPPGPHLLTVDGPALIEVIGLAALFSQDEKRKPWVRLALSAEQVGVSGGEGDNQIVSALPAGSFSYTGEDVTIAFTASSLIEPAKLAKGRLAFGFAENAPFLVTDLGDATVTYVSGPMRG